MTDNNEDEKKPYLHNLDSDKDGLSDYEELYVYHTDPHDPDTDKDGVSDGDEVKMGRNPKGSGTLKDLFIPYLGNEYKPHALRMPRLAFYAAVVIAVKMIVTGTVLAYPLAAFLTPELMTAESKKIIRLTNNIRVEKSLSVLRENSLLNSAALQKAQDMLLNQYFAHIGPGNKNVLSWMRAVGYQYEVAGENLAMGFSNADEVVTAWTKSRTHYANIIDPDFKDIGVGMVSGPYGGKDTTLVAQYFGTTPGGQPATVVAAADKVPVPQPVVTRPAPVKPAVTVNNNKIATTVAAAKPVVVTKPVVVKVTPVTPAPVLTVATVTEPVVVQATSTTPATTTEPLPALSAPKIIYPENNSLINSGQINFLVSAGTAQTVAILVNGKEVVRSSKPQNGQFDLPVTLADGNYKILAKAYNGKAISNSAYLNLTIDQTLPEADLEKTKLIVVSTAGQNDLIVRAVAFVTPDTDMVAVEFSGQTLKLEKEVDENATSTVRFVGSVIVYNKQQKDLFDPVTLPVLNMVDAAGNVNHQDISWQGVLPVKPSLLKQYLFIRQNPWSTLELMFDISGWYYKLILGIAILALLVNVFVEIKKQYASIIASTLGFIGLLVFLIII